MKTIPNLSYLLFLSCFLVSLNSCTYNVAEDPVPSNARQIWTGPTVTFEKADGADPNQEANQDRITDNVWITRDNGGGQGGGGQIFNIQAESGPNKDNSPVGTLWAEGQIENVDNLQFRNFRETVDQPKRAVGRDLVVWLVDENIYLSLKFTSWSRNGDGGFAYERSSR